MRRNAWEDVVLLTLSWRFPDSMRQGVQTVSGGPKVSGAQLEIADSDYALDVG